MTTRTYQRYLTFAILIYIIVFSIYSILRHESFLTKGYDLGIFMQSLWTTAFGEGFFFNTAEWEDVGTLSHFGVHNSPLLILLVPIYRVFPYPETLLILQSIAIGVGASALFKLAREVVNERKAFYISLMYLFNPIIHGINRFDFHPVSLVIPFIFLIPYYYDKKKYMKMILSSFIVLSAKEDAGLVLISLAWFFIVKKYGIRNSVNIRYILRNFSNMRWEIFLGILGIIWIIGSIFFVIPHFNGGHYPYLDGGKLQRYSFDSGIYWDYLVIFFLVSIISLAGLPLLNKNFLVTSFPLWIEILIPSTTTNMLAIGYHYPYMLIPFLFIISTYALSDTREIKVVMKLNSENKSIRLTMKKALAISITTMLLFSPAFHVLNMPYIRGVPFHTLIEIHEEWESYFLILDNISKRLSSSTCPITTQNYLFPHIANRKNSYYLLTPFNSSYLPNNSIVLLASSLPDYPATAKILEDPEITANKTYFVIDINQIIIQCYKKHGNDETMFNQCIVGTINSTIEVCEKSQTQN